jgi:hypothetical protein
MAKEIKTRARSLESTLEGVEIKDPLFRPLCWLSHLSETANIQRENRAREPSRRGIASSSAIFQRHPHLIVRLVSRVVCAILTPVHNCFPLPVPGLLRRTRKEPSTSFLSLPLTLRRQRSSTSSVIVQMWSPRGGVAPDRQREPSNLHRIDDFASEQ